ncbi:GAF and ANTAR domain-containing protein [Amycolatopsis sp. NPDC021455]|uniref:GAF and ANTAR domain-containing protein n=1 Tax=Amycolatopsis sp. NPDC021455 TaxID=3154901 RepID=UPI0033CB2193
MTGQPRAGTDGELRRLRAVLDLADDREPAVLLHLLARYCVELLGVLAAAVVLADPDGELRVAAASDAWSRRLAQRQLDLGRGPALDVHRTGDPVRADDLTKAADRWPGFATEAVAAGFEAVTALPLRRKQDIGSVILFGDGQPPGPDLELAWALAEAATLGVLRDRAIRRGETLARQLQRALDSRIVIEQAKGVLAQAGDLPVDEVFILLRDYSRRHSEPLHDVAREVVRRTLAPARILDPQGADPPVQLG